MIHKFRDMPVEINDQKNIYVLIDEAHRTTGGDLGNYLMAALPNATCIGFTGTPIDKTAYGKGTFKIFCYRDSTQESNCCQRRSCFFSDGKSPF